MWTLSGVFADSKKDMLKGSTLKFTSQSETSDGLLLEGAFSWRFNGVLLGTEVVKGHYLAASRGIFLEGVTIQEQNHPGIPRGSLVLGSYSAVLSEDGRALVNGRNGSTAASDNVPMRWEAER